MMYASDKQQLFWSTYQDILEKSGNPFFISYNKHWAAVNRPTAAWNEPVIMMDFLTSHKILRINAFLLNDVALYKYLIDHKSEIEKSLGFVPQWVHGDKGENTYRIKIELSYNHDSVDSYFCLIKKSLPIIMKFISTFKPYIKC